MSDDRIIIDTATAPKAIGPYSQAVKIGNFLFISGQIPLGLDGKIVGSDITTQTRQVLKNLTAIVEASSMGLVNVVKCSCFLKNMADFAAFNAIYSEYFKSILPARECIEAVLPKDALVEISAICVK